MPQLCGMNKKLFTLLLLISFLICYLQWPGHSMFVFQLECEVLFGEHDKIDSFMHPAILLPFVGELFFIFALFQNKHWPIASGIILCGLLVLFFLLVGILGLNWKIIVSTLPFLGSSVFYFVRIRRPEKWPIKDHFILLLITNSFNTRTLFSLPLLDAGKSKDRFRISRHFFNFKSTIELLFRKSAFAFGLFRWKQRFGHNRSK